MAVLNGLSACLPYYALYCTGITSRSYLACLSSDPILQEMRHQQSKQSKHGSVFRGFTAALTRPQQDRIPSAAAAACCCFLFLQCLFSQLSGTHAYIYVNNETYASLPALFGRFLLDGKTYGARLQYFHDNPYMCELDERTKRQFVLPGGPQIPDSKGGNVTLAEPVILLVSRGNCPFQRKAAVAESLHDTIRFLLVFNFNVDHTREQEEVLVPMYSQFGNTRLVLLSVSHGTGQALKLFLSQQPPEVTAVGGPFIEFDSEPPLGILTAADLQSMMLSALGLFFMLISFTGCLIILAGTYSQIAQQQGGGGGNPIAAATQRRLLTQDEVHQLTAATTVSSATTVSDIESSAEAGSSLDRADTAAAAAARSEDSGEPQEEHQCAVCLDEFESESEITALPCHHVFHTGMLYKRIRTLAVSLIIIQRLTLPSFPRSTTFHSQSLDCILPWLTERQSKCPLCKYDVLQHLREQNGEGGAGHEALGSSISVWDRIRRYRWTSVHMDDASENSTRDGIMVVVDSSNSDLRLEEDPNSGVELTQRRNLSGGNSTSRT